ncbi:MAG: LacI family DNA-binding transcriptional regulator [Christensenellales bacterium]
MAVTIRDVAALAGVSPSTVSRTCQNSPSSARTPSGASVRRQAARLCHGRRPGAVPAPRTIGVILPPSAREVYENPSIWR